jgi:tetratricopeptide (TPR) repeat protein
VERRARSRPIAGVIALLAVLTAVTGCSGDGGVPERPSPVPLPAGVETFEAPIREQLRDRHGELVRTLADPGASPERIAAAFGRLGTSFHAHELPEAAAECYRRAAELAPSDPRWPYYLGHAEHKLGRWPAARAAFTRVLELDPGDLPSRVWRGEVALDSGDLEAAEADFLQALDADPSCDKARVGVARVALARGRPERAVELLEEALVRQPDAGVVHYHLALAYRDLGEEERSRRHLARLPAGPPSRDAIRFRDERMAALARTRVGSRVHDLRALQALDEGRYQLAVAELRQVLAIAPDRVYAHYNLARALLATGRPEAAVEELHRLLEAVPGDVPSHLLLARIHADAGRPEEAEEQLRAALAADPDSAEARRALAELARR